MKQQQEYLIEPTPKPTLKNALALFATFAFAFVFFFGSILILWTVSPLASSIVNLTLATRSQEKVVAQLPLSPNRAIPLSTPSNEATSLYPIQESFEPLHNLEEAGSNWIRIPSIQVNVPVTESPSLKDSDILATLNKGAALYPNGVTPGALGNAFISAHSTGEPWKGAYRFAFVRINELKAGDPLYIDWHGARYAYRITTTEVVTPTANFRVISDRPVPTISLMACWPLWSTKQRMLIHAELTNITQLTKPAI